MVRRGVEAGDRRRKSRDALTSRPEVERLLDAASAPASPRELAGERAAVDLFARARLVSPAALTASPRSSSRAAFKAAAASVAAVVAMSGGVSFAATGHVPFSGTLRQVTRAVTGHASDRPSAERHLGRTDSTPPSGPNAAALLGLCQAFQRGQKATHGHAFETRPFRALVAAAGGEDQVPDFCASLPPHGPSDASHPTHPAHPTHPTEGPSSGPTDPGHTDATHPTHPAHPTQPVQPTQPTRPTHPTHPAQPTPTQNPSRSASPHRTHSS